MSTLHQRFTVNFSYPVVFTRDAFALDNPSLADVMRQGGRPHSRALVVIDSEVASLTPGLLERISRYGEAHRELMEFVAPPFLVRGGEICKHEPVEVERIHALVERHKICRHSFIVAIGGGAVLDAAGYAAATAHRGVRLIRMPTTVLAQFPVTRVLPSAGDALSSTSRQLRAHERDDAGHRGHHLGIRLVVCRVGPVPRVVHAQLAGRTRDGIK